MIRGIGCYEELFFDGDGATRLNLGTARRAIPTQGNDGWSQPRGRRGSAPRKPMVGMDRRAVPFLRRSRLIPNRSIFPAQQRGQEGEDEGWDGGEGEDMREW